MLYAILIYDSDKAVKAMTPAEDDAIMARHLAIHESMRAKGQLGPVARLETTDRARTYRPNGRPPVTDGPFAETKEQLLGFYIVNCASEDEALAIARSLPVLESVFEVRPIRAFFPGIEGLAG